MEKSSGSKQVKQDSYKLMGSSNYSLSVTVTFASLSCVIFFEEVCVEDGSYGHIPDYSSYVGTASFGDSHSSFVVSRFIDNRVKSCKGNEFFIRAFEFFYILHFSEEGSGAYFTHTRDRRKYFHFSGTKKLDVRDEFIGEDLEFFLELKESSDFTFEDDFSVRVINTYGVVGDFEYIRWVDVDFSSLSFVDFDNNILDMVDRFAPCHPCRRDMEEEVEPCSGEDIVMVGKFLEDVKEDLFYLSFYSCNFSGEIFSFSGEEFNGVIGGEFVDGVSVLSEEVSDDFSVNFVSFSFSEGRGFVEVMYKYGVDEGDRKIVCKEEGEEIDVIVRGGFNGDGEVYRRGEVKERVFEFLEMREILGEFEGFNKFSLRVNDSDVETIFGNINTHKEVNHGLTSFLRFFSFGGEDTSLPSSRVIRDHSPNQLMREKGRGGHTPLRAQDPVCMLSPASVNKLYCLRRSVVTYNNYNAI